MMKKLLTVTCLFATIGAVNAQNFKIKAQPAQSEPIGFAPIQNVAARTSTAVTMNDTLCYFYDKHKFCNTPGNDQLFYTVAGTGAAASSGTLGDLVEFGNSFLNNGSSVTISGAFFLASRQSNSTNTVIPVKMFLYNASAAGVPTTKIDSALGAVTNTNGVFNYIQFATPRTVTGSFFISYKPYPMSQSDTLLSWVSGAGTSTASAAQGWTTSEKYGESLGFTRWVISTTPTNNAIFSNTNFYGTGFDLEPQILPTVSFSVNPSYTVTPGAATITPGAYCTSTTTTMTYTNTSTSSVVYNRQFNFNSFIPYWSAITGFNFTVTPNAADPINNWVFTNNPTNTVTTTNGANTVSTAGTYSTTLTLKYRPSPFSPSAQKPSISNSTSSTFTTVNCTTVGLPEIAGFENMNVYPNPTISGKTTITGLTGNNTVLVYDMLGQLVMSQVSDKETVSVDLANKANGSYFIKIMNANNSVRVVKIINQN